MSSIGVVEGLSLLVAIFSTGLEQSGVRLRARIVVAVVAWAAMAAPRHAEGTIAFLAGRVAIPAALGIGSICAIQLTSTLAGLGRPLLAPRAFSAFRWLIILVSSAWLTRVQSTSSLVLFTLCATVFTAMAEFCSSRDLPSIVMAAAFMDAGMLPVYGPRGGIVYLALSWWLLLAHTTCVAAILVSLRLEGIDLRRLRRCGITPWAASEVALIPLTVTWVLERSGFSVFHGFLWLVLLVETMSAAFVVASLRVLRGRMVKEVVGAP